MKSQNILAKTILVTGLLSISSTSFAAQEPTRDEVFEQGIYYLTREKSSQDEKQKDYLLGLEKIQNAADQGFPEAVYSLGLMYFKGELVRKDYSQAKRWFQKGAENNHAMSQYKLAKMYLSGLGGKVDISEAKKWFKRASANGVEEAKYNIDLINQKRASQNGTTINNHKGNDAHHQKMFKIHKKHAENGNMESEYNLGIIYKLGYGVEKNDQLAEKYLKLSADKGYLDAKMSLATLYSDTARYQLAIPLYQSLTTEDDYGLAYYALGQLYLFGKGLDKDETQALTLFKKAANKNIVAANYSIGMMYLNGYGVEKDFYIGYAYIALSAEQNDTNAKKSMSFLRSKMTPQDISKGEEALAELKTQLKL